MSANGMKPDKDEFEIRLSELGQSVDQLSKEVKDQSLEFIKHEQQDLRIMHDVGFIKKNVEDIKIELRDLAHIIRGNGSPGITTRLAILEELKKSKVSSATQFVTLVAALLALFGTIAGAFITKL